MRLTHAWGLLITQAPIVLAAAILLGFLARSLLPRSFSASGSPKQMVCAALPWLLMLFFVVFPMVSSSAFRAFSCEDFSNGQSFLRADFAIKCHTEAYDRVERLAWVGILLYPVGISVLCEWQPFEQEIPPPYYVVYSYWLICLPPVLCHTDAVLLLASCRAILDERPTALSKALGFLVRDYEPGFR